MARQNGFSIRLASRSGLFGCSVVGLLFLPAAGNYWTVDADSSRETVARSLRLENKVLQAFANSRWGRFCIRLASRENCQL